LSVQALAGLTPISDLANEHGVSRKFIYHQAAKASQALDDAFAPEPQQERVLFHLPVTKHWIRQFVLAQSLIGHTSAEGIVEILEDLFDYHNICPRTVGNILQDAVAKSRLVNDTEDLSAIRVGVHDEIFQANRPVLVGCCADSTYCYLLVAEDHRDGTTWGVHLLDLSERGLDLHHSIADEGKGLRAGQFAAWGTGVPCYGDVFHAELHLGRLAFYLDNRARGCVCAREKLERQMARAKKKNQGTRLSKRLAMARQAEARAVELARDVAALADWMKQDILAVAGPNLSNRQLLFDFVVAELHEREDLCPHRIGPVRRLLERHRDDLLAFAADLDDRWDEIASSFGVPRLLVQQVCELHALDPNRPLYWQRQATLYKHLGRTFHRVDSAVAEVLAQTHRASSLVENLNGRLRNYFHLRGHIGNGYLDLLRFFLNHRRFRRSRRPQRVGRSPAELLTAQTHAHWLELLGYRPFQLN
jgi:hypothetical protein